MEADKLDGHILHASMKRTRRRGRDVHSRYMIPPSPRSAPSSPIHLSSITSSYTNQLNIPKPRISSLSSSPDVSDAESEPSSRYADENHHSFETPLHLGVQRKAPNTQRRHAVRLFSENISDTQTLFFEQQKARYGARVGTPMARDSGVCTLKPICYTQTQLRSTKKTSNHVDKSNTLTSGFMDDSSEYFCTSMDVGAESCSVSVHRGLCSSPLIRTKASCRARQASEIRSSMPEADILPTSSRKLTEVEEVMIRHSLNANLLNCPVISGNLVKTVSNKTPGKETCNLGRVCLPPQPLNSRLGLDLKKGKKGLNKKEDVYLPFLLHNQYLQWRFLNAEAKKAAKSRAITAKISFLEVSKHIEDLRDSVMKKRLELAKLQRWRKLFNIIDLEMPFVEEWTHVNGEYSASFSDTIKALQDASIRLPVIGDVRVDAGELKDFFLTATSLFESISPAWERFSQNVDIVSKLISELAIVAGKEKLLIEECGDLLSKAHGLQIKDWSLRSMLMQAKAWDRSLKSLLIKQAVAV